jgi:hypothetical protein
MSSIALDLPLERTRWFRDADDVLSTVKRSDEVVQLVINWVDALATSETVSSVAYVDSGVTRSSTSADTTTSTTSVTGNGETEVTATLSTGRVLQKVVRFYSPSGMASSDYR